MKKRILFYFLAAAGALLITVTDGFSTSGRGNDVNTACAPEVIFTGDCLLCHTTGAKKEYTPAMDAYVAGGSALTDFFCPTPVVSYTLPRNVNMETMGIADFDGDTYPDVLVRNRLNGRWYLNLMQADTVLLSTNLHVIRDLNEELAGIDDFNGDGKADILLRNTVSGRWLMYLMDGTTVLLKTGVSLGKDLNLQLAETADFDGDGNADVLIRDIVSGRWFMYQMDGATVLLRIRL